jgi:hypothetical protein
MPGATWCPKGCYDERQENRQEHLNQIDHHRNMCQYCKLRAEEDPHIKFVEKVPDQHPWVKNGKCLRRKLAPHYIICDDVRKIRKTCRPCYIELNLFNSDFYEKDPEIPDKDNPTPRTIHPFPNYTPMPHAQIKEFPFTHWRPGQYALN